MTHYTEQLRQLQLQTARKHQLEAMLDQLYSQRPTLADKADTLLRASQKEQLDVDKLEGGSLAAFFYHATGRMDEKLDKERQEAYAARVRYDAAAHELAAVEETIRRYEGELRRLEGCEQEYGRLLNEKAQAVKAAGGESAEAIFRLEQQLTDNLSRQKELREAITAGSHALRTADQILEHLDAAGGLATWDVLGGGILADLAKHDRLDQAQHQVQCLQAQLRRFKTELADVNIHANLQVNIEGFARFADYFFDGLLADLSIKEMISQARQQTLCTRQDIAAVLNKLEGLRTSAQNEHTRLQAQLDTHVVDAPL